VPRADWSVKTKKAKPGDVIGYRNPGGNSYWVEMKITNKLVVTAAGSCANDGSPKSIVRLDNISKPKGGKNSAKRVGFYWIDPELAR